MGGWTYILTNKPRGVLYVGVTANLAARMAQHRTGSGSSFCRRYGPKRLVLVECHEEIAMAITRVKALKAWKRDWKIKLIEQANPGWEDLFDHLAQP
ncbi:excinuclease ABC subunit C [Novosphingobium sp. PC22D]|uniref:GIY-YIG nuclease family protein n=1 Tax=Novosphingobium sp. PC22D TaxID=1962403 RepID=UPI000BF1FC58|nr:GIY-YIG nuclease family protein [Novosphingobium sp. PC22D]PEQ12733.1 excinuclease ABC subunit C [Novosphingobium sp. PC22D]